MFNLIVSGGGWEPHRDSFGSGCVLEYTDAAIAQRLMPNKVLDINAVAKLPTLFMSETQGAGMLPKRSNFNKPLELDHLRHLINRDNYA